jgi:hypothetical protein
MMSRRRHESQFVRYVPLPSWSRQSGEAERGIGATKMDG